MFGLWVQAIVVLKFAPTTEQGYAYLFAGRIFKASYDSVVWINTALLAGDEIYQAESHLRAVLSGSELGRVIGLRHLCVSRQW